MRRYIVIIGAMKSGTTTLFDQLAQHPAIAPASHKEPGFFAFEEVWQQGYDWFDTLFDFDPDQHRYRLEASTDYTKAPFVSGVWERMTARPDVEFKLLYIMRHPLRRMESHARHTERNRRELGRYLSPRSSHSFDEGLSPVSLAASAYASQLDHFEAARAAGNLHCLTLEALKTDPRGTMAEVWDYLGLEPLETDETMRASNAAKDRTRVHPLWQALAGIKPLLLLVKALLPRGLRDRISARFRKTPSKVEGRFTLDESEIAFLETFFRDDLTRLRDVHQVDISPWKID